MNYLGFVLLLEHKNLSFIFDLTNAALRVPSEMKSGIATPRATKIHELKRARVPNSGEMTEQFSNNGGVIVILETLAKCCESSYFRNFIHKPQKTLKYWIYCRNRV